MPTIGPITLAAETDDVTANNLAASFTSSGTLYAASLNSTSGDLQSAWYFALGATIPRYNVVSDAPFQVWHQAQPASTTVVVEFQLFKAGSPSAPTTLAGVVSATVTTAKVTFNASASATTVPQLITIQLKDMLNEILQTTAVSSVVIRVRDQNRSYVNNNRIAFRNYGWDTASRPTLTVTHAAPPAVTGQVTETYPAFSIVSEANVGTAAVTGQTTVTFPAWGVDAEGSMVAPTPVSAQSTITFPAWEIDAYVAEADKTKHTFQGVEQTASESHYFITEDGTVLGFSTSFDDTLGTIPTGMIGLDDDTWLPEAGQTSANPEALELSAFLLDRDVVDLDAAVFGRLLPDVRRLWLPSGMVRDIHYALLNKQPKPYQLDTVVFIKTRRSKHPILDFTDSQLFFAQDSTTEIPVIATDSAGGVTSSIYAQRMDSGMMTVAPRLSAIGDPSGIMSLGPAVSPANEFDPTSIAVSLTSTFLTVSIRGVQTRIRMLDLGSILNQPFVLTVFWTPHSGLLGFRTPKGMRTYPLAVGAPVDLAQRILTIGTRSDGVGTSGFFGLGSSQLKVPALTMTLPARNAVERGLEDYYDQLSRPGRVWSIRIPDMSLSVTRSGADPTQTPGIAPGESVMLYFDVQRVGNYTGPITATAFETSPTQTLTVGTPTPYATSGDTTTYQVQVSAIAGTTEAVYPLRFYAKATTADVDGSFFVKVRGSSDFFVEVAATPAIMPNPTVVLQVKDAVQGRPEIILEDTSTQANTFSFFDLARPGRQGINFLVPKYGTSGVVSGVLTNSAQAQRMSTDHSALMVLRELDKSDANGVLFALLSDATTGSFADGIWVLRVTGGVKVRTLIGGTAVTSPDTLAWSAGDLELGVRITSTSVILTNRTTMLSISIPRPAWADAGVRVMWGCVRTPSGSRTNNTRVNVQTFSLHPYALSDIQFRRNMDKLRTFVSAGDGKPEYPDKFLVIGELNDATTDQPQEKKRNRAAPARGLVLKSYGTVNSLPSGIATLGDAGNVFTTEFIPQTSSTDGWEAVCHLKNLSAADDYVYQFAWADDSQYNGYGGIGKRYDGVARYRGLTNDADWLYGDFAKVSKTGDTLWCIAASGSGKVHTINELVSGESRVVTRDSTLNGKVSVSIGATWRQDGSAKFPGAGRGYFLGFHYGTMTAQERADLKRILIG